MAKTIHRDNYTIINRTHHVDDEDWDIIFKRNKRNEEKNRYKRGHKREK